MSRLPTRPVEQKQPLVRSEKYRRWVASQPCAACGREGATQAAHLRIMQQAGMSRKPSDELCIPLCVSCHSDQHRDSEARFWRETLAYMKTENLAKVIAGWRRDEFRKWKEG